MSSLLAIRVRNLRGLADSDWIEMRPLTLLVGANSSGKSSLLRLFPLLKQSVLTPTRGPMLWYDDNVVDFGSFSEARRKGGEEFIEFEYELDLTPPANDFPLWDGTICVVVVRLVEAHEGGTRHAVCTINAAGLSCVLELGENGAVTQIRCGADSIMTPAWHLNPDSLIPAPAAFWTASAPILEASARIVAHLRAKAHGNATATRLEAIAGELKFGGLEHVRVQLGNCGLDSIEHYPRLLELAANLQPFLLIRAAPQILATANAFLTQFARDTAYVRPFRADPKRSYRRQDLSVGQIDPTGGNLAMFLRSMTDTERSSFAQWTNEYFDFTVRATSISGQVSIGVRVADAEEFSLVDVGYGYSQLLPILAQLWLASQRRRPTQRRLSIVCAEQPELHLHPAFQRRLAGALSGAVATVRGPGQRPTPLFVETHSQSIITGVGEAVASKTIRPNDVQVLFFSKTAGKVEIRKVEFDEAGSLSANWPFGFLEP